MQRIASVALLAAMLAGCTQVHTPPPASKKPIANRAVPIKRAAPRYVSRPLPPLPPPLPPAPARGRIAPRQGYSFNTSEILPDGRIRPGRWKTIIVHHSAGRDDTPQSMDHFHRTVRKWENGLGYHFVIGNGVSTVDGKIYPGPRWYRQMTGAHCKTASGSFFGVWRPENYFNDNGIGICLVGHFDQSRPTPRQLKALEELMRLLCQELRIPATSIYTHGQVTGRTECPGRNLITAMGPLRGAIARQVAGGPAGMLEAALTLSSE